MKVKFTDTGPEYIVDVSVSVSAPRRGNGKTYLYISGQPSPEDIEGGLSRPTPSLKGEDAELDAAWKLYNKAEVKLMLKGIKQAMPLIQQAINDNTALSSDDISKYKLVWDRNAGCGCGCSPGFRLKDHTNGYRAVSLSLDRSSVQISVTFMTEEQRSEHHKKMLASRIKSTQKKIDDIAAKIQALGVERVELEKLLINSLLDS